MGDIKTPAITLDEIFHYLEQADKPCLVSIDEFQVIDRYPEKNVEAILRTHIQHCSNAKFIYAGSQRHMMGEIFMSPARPFYQSTAVMELHPIEMRIYTQFIKNILMKIKGELQKKQSMKFTTASKVLHGIYSS